MRMAINPTVRDAARKLGILHKNGSDCDINKLIHFLADTYDIHTELVNSLENHIYELEQKIK
jgi:hypothetical protein